MKILGIDTETTGLDCTKDRITEIGACLLDWNTGTPLQMLSMLVIPEIPIPEEVVKLNGITEEMIEQYGVLEEDAMRELGCLMEDADFFMAHNAQFDRGFVEAARNRRGLINSGKAWLCTREDIKYGPEITTRHLNYLAAEAGFVNPFKHRAIFDVLTMFKIAEQFELDDIIKRNLEPTIYVQALVSFDEKELAKAKMFQWCGPKKIWWKSMKLSDLDAEKPDYAFHINILNEKPE